MDLLSANMGRRVGVVPRTRIYSVDCRLKSHSLNLTDNFSGAHRAAELVYTPQISAMLIRVNSIGTIAVNSCAYRGAKRFGLVSSKGRVLRCNNFSETFLHFSRVQVSVLLQRGRSPDVGWANYF